MEIAKKGSYVYWFTYKNVDGATQTTLPQRFKGKSTTLDTEALGGKFSGAKLYVMNKDTGNVAIADFSAPKEGDERPVKLTADDFQYVRSVKLSVVSEDGKPLENALVNITDGMNTPMTAVITPADQGVATFTDVATGELTVKVQAKGLKRTIDSDIELPEKRKTPGFDRQVKVAGDVDTLDVKPTAAAPSTKASKSAPAPGVSTGSIILQTIAGVIFLAIVIAVIYAILKSKGVTAKSALNGMGVQFPMEQGSPVADSSVGQSPAPGGDPSICEFCGQRKDASGNCGCTVAPGASPFGASTGVAQPSPRLIGTQGAYAGHIFELTSDSAVIGRDAGNSVALPNDTTASRRHAVIARSNGDFTISDQGSSNGTFVNGSKITQQKLTPGDEVQIGGTKFRFEA